MSGARKAVLVLFAVAVLMSVPMATAYGSAFALYSGPTAPVGVAVNKAGTVYWANYDIGQLLALPKGASSPTVL